MLFKGSTALIILLLNSKAVANSEPVHETKVSINLDCGHNFNSNKGSTQPCLTVSSLRLTHTRQISKKIFGMIRLDPLGTTSESFENRPLIFANSFPKPKLGLIDDFSLTWKFKENLTLSFEEFGGTTRLPSTSKLFLASGFQRAGWDQTALVATYQLPPLEGMEVVIAIGNGEGEVEKNLDPQQYGGIEVNAKLTPSFLLKMGLSFDGNNVGGHQYSHTFENYISSNDLSLSDSGFTIYLDT